MIDRLKKEWLLYQWRRKGHRKKTVRLKVRDVATLLRNFNEQHIRYVVLRWFEEVPMTEQAERDYTQDIDLLIDVRDIEVIAQRVCQHPSGTMKCDLYGVNGAYGTAYKGMPYYPPVLAEYILQHRTTYQEGFYVPEPEVHFLSLAYHLVYHKGLEAGIPSGCELPCETRPKRPYREKLEELGQSLGPTLARPYTLLGLHEYLKTRDWEMPPDLIERWPRQTEWHKYLLRHEREHLREWAEKLPHLLVFFIREDAEKNENKDMICDMLRDKFSILKMEHLTETQVARVMRKVRGGNWIEHKKTTLLKPKIAVICYDFNPVTMETADPKHRNSYPLVKNHNVFRKHEIRAKLNDSVNASRRIIGIHGSDNGYESQHMLRAIYDKDLNRMNQEIWEQVRGKSSDTTREGDPPTAQGASVPTKNLASNVIRKY